MEESVEISDVVQVSYTSQEAQTHPPFDPISFPSYYKFAKNMFLINMKLHFLMVAKMAI